MICPEVSTRLGFLHSFGRSSALGSIVVQGLRMISIFYLAHFLSSSLYILILIHLLLPLLGEALPESRVARELGCVL